MEFVTPLNVMLFFVSLLVLGGIASTLVSRKFGAPVLLVFLALGMLAGEDGPGGIGFSNFPLMYLIGSLSLAVILFDGGMRLKLEDLKANLWPSLSLATLGVVITTAVVGVVAFNIFDFSWLEAMLLGAILASTDAAAVMSLIRSSGVKIPTRLVHTLEIESGLNDPIAIFMTLTLVKLIASPGLMGWGLVATLAQEGLVGAACGIGGGYALSWLLHRLRLSSSLSPLFVLAGAILVFSTASLAHGSGFLAVYLAGVIFSSRPMHARENVLKFHDSITLLAQMVMFVALGLLVAPSHLIPYAVPALVIAVTLTLIARPLAVWLCLLPFPRAYSGDEKNFMSWLGLRGAVAIFLAGMPKLSGLDHAGIYFNVAFFVVLLSLLVKGWSIPTVANFLGLAGKSK